jgi:nonsense-mediated mRNA decay protein 3
VQDLLILPKALSPGRRPSLLLVIKLSSVIHIIDPVTLEKIELSATKFFRHPFSALLSHSKLVPFVVLDVDTDEAERIGTREGGGSVRERGGVLAEAVVAKESDLGANDRTYSVRTHLGHVLRVGDRVLGYDLGAANVDDDVITTLPYEPPDVVLVRKVHAENGTRRSVRKRNTDDGESVTATATVIGEDLEVEGDEDGERDLEWDVDELHDQPIVPEQDQQVQTERQHVHAGEEELAALEDEQITGNEVHGAT